MRTPIVIGHRGAPGHRPEHTLPCYELAVRMGADFIEPDLVCTADGVLVARHDAELSGTTDIATRPDLAHLRRVDGWSVEDLKLAQVRTLRAVERLPELRRVVGVYLELKDPARFARLGLPFGPPLLAALEAAGLNTPDAPVIVESFESLRELRDDLRVPIGQLVEPGAEVPVAVIAEYAQAVGAHKDLVIPHDAAGRLTTPTPLVAEAHAAGLAVHCWTFRDEAQFRPTGLNATGELTAFFAASVDGVFADSPDTAVAARRSWMMSR